MDRKKSVDSVKKFDAKKECGSKILQGDALLDAVKKCRERGCKIVLTMGSWDLLHIGHARYMKAAKEYGDVLIVGVDSDQKVKNRKGPDRPVVPEDERMEMIGHLGCADIVTLKDHDAPKWHMIKAVEPDVLIAVDETYTPEKLEQVKKLCGEVVVLRSQATTSTSAKIRRLQITTANKVEKRLRPKLIATIEEVLNEIKGK
ncbi:MAG: adenylyltransferase/cytidyltransferase family protein [Patescibacteria group bacterium]|nr:adenylyltransferase/cytidyltransferase family protein [Patescibacteria group bacterium]